MKLENVLPSITQGEAFGRKSWYMADIQYMPRLRRGREGFFKRNKNPQTLEVTLDEYALTDEDRLADDWMVVQGNDDPNLG